jgi:hypothetical protein
VKIRRGPATVSLTKPSTTGDSLREGMAEEDGKPGDRSFEKNGKTREDRGRLLHSAYVCGKKIVQRGRSIWGGPYFLLFAVVMRFCSFLPGIPQSSGACIGMLPAWKCSTGGVKDEKNDDVVSVNRCCSYVCYAQ